MNKWISITAVLCLILSVSACKGKASGGSGGNGDENGDDNNNKSCVPIGLVEVCGNEVDEDCDGVVAECLPCEADSQIIDRCYCQGEISIYGFCCSSGWSPVDCSCGNGSVEPDEDCDGSDLNGETCESLGYDAGTLSCHHNCRFNASACPGAAHRLLMEDFEDRNFLDLMMTTVPTGTDCYGGSGFASTAIVDHKTRQGNYSLRWDACNSGYDPRTSLPGCSNVFLMAGGSPSISEMGTPIDIETPVALSKEVYVQYWTRYENDNDTIDRFLAEKFAVGAISGTLSFTIAGSGFGMAMDSYLYGSNHPLVFVHDGEWHKIAYYHKYNDPGDTNSILRGWVDDQLVFEWVDLHEFSTTAWLLRMKHFHTAGMHFSFCTSAPTHLDDYEVWDKMPDIFDCANGEITNLCWCGGSSRNYGYCYNDYWNPLSMPSCVPSKEICNDGIDNDCDGNTDCADSDCKDLSMCTALECDNVNISVATRHTHQVYFNGDYLGHYTGVDVAKREYSAPLRKGQNTVAVIVSYGEPLLARIEYCGNVIVSDTSWKTTIAKPLGWKEPGMDTSTWNDAVFVADWGSTAVWFYSHPADWPSPEADWIWTSDIPEISVPAPYSNGFFRKDFEIE